MKKQKLIDEIRADYHLFFDIQIGKYLKQVNKGEFDTQAEAKRIINKIINIWNEKISVEKEKLDTLDKAAKAGWFNSIEIDFINTNIDKYRRVIPAKIKPSNEIMGKVLPGLTDSELNLVPFCWTLLEPHGYKYERMRDIIAGSEPLEIEIELIRWAYKIVNTIDKALRAKSVYKAEELINAAYKMACEKLKKETARIAVIKVQGDLTREMKKTGK